jgi:hypothetical protein
MTVGLLMALLLPASSPVELASISSGADSAVVGWNGKEAVVTVRTREGTAGHKLEVIREGGRPETLDFLSTKTPEAGAVRLKGTISGRPGQRVWWRSSWDDGLQPWHFFQFPSAQSAPTDFLIFGDAQARISTVSAELFAKAARLAPKSEFSLHAGDLVDNNMSEKEWREWLYAIKPLVRQGPVFATPGNHEYGKPGDFKGLSPYWNPLLNHPSNGPETLKNTAWHVLWSGIMIASIDSMADHKSQIEWLRSLPWEKARWKIVISHFPVQVTMKGQEKPGWTKMMESACKDLDIDLVVTGHLHSYARTTASKKPVYVVLNSGGKFYRQDSFPWMEAKLARTPLFIKAQARSSALTLTAYDAEGKARDKWKVME